MVSESFLKFGVLNRFFIDVIRYYGSIMFQVMPNGWAHLIRLYVLFVECKMSPPTLEKFSWFYTWKANKGGQGSSAVTKIRESLGY